MRTVRTQILYIDANIPVHETVQRLFAQRFRTCDVTCCESLEGAIQRETMIHEHQIVIYGAKSSDDVPSLRAIGLTLEQHFQVAKRVLFVNFVVRAADLNFHNIVEMMGFPTLADIVDTLLPKPPTDPT